MLYRWARFGPGYEVSSAGDRRFSAFYATLCDGRTIEQHYQCDIKGYRTIREGKGRLPLRDITPENLWRSYLSLWDGWAVLHPYLLRELAYFAGKHGGLLTDKFANSNINQARALAFILNEQQPVPANLE